MFKTLTIISLVPTSWVPCQPLIRAQQKGWQGVQGFCAVIKQLFVEYCTYIYTVEFS